MTLLSIFSRLEDPRSGPAKRCGLSEIIVMAICAVLCGADDWVEVADWCEDESQWPDLHPDIFAEWFDIQLSPILCDLSAREVEREPFQPL